MSITSTNKIFNLTNEQYGYNVKTFRPIPAGSTIEMFIPTLMGTITKTGTDTIVINSLFDNEIKPNVSTKVKLAKSIKVTLRDNCQWMDKVDGSNQIPKGSKFYINFLDGDIQRPTTTTA